MTALDAAEAVLRDAGSELRYAEITARALQHGCWTSKSVSPHPRPCQRLGWSRCRSRTPRSACCVRRADRSPLHYREITRRAIDRGYVVTQGKTPEAILYGVIFNEAQRATKRGEAPRFERLGKGLIGLARRPREGLSSQIAEQNRAARSSLLERIKTMNPTEFEELVGRLLTALGFEDVSVTSPSNDGSLGAHEQGLIITTSDFSKGARADAAHPSKTPVGLMDGKQLVALLVEHEIEAKRAIHYFIEIEPQATDDIGGD